MFNVNQNIYKNEIFCCVKNVRLFYHFNSQGTEKSVVSRHVPFRTVPQRRRHRRCGRRRPCLQPAAVPHSAARRGLMNSKRGRLTGIRPTTNTTPAPTENTIQ